MRFHRYFLLSRAPVLQCLLQLFMRLVTVLSLYTSEILSANFNSVFVVTVHRRLKYSWVYRKSKTLFLSRWTKMVDDNITLQERFATHTFPLTPVYSRCLISNPGGHSKENWVGACGEFLSLWTGSLVKDGAKRKWEERGGRGRERGAAPAAAMYVQSLWVSWNPCPVSERNLRFSLYFTFVNLWVGLCRWGYISYIGEYPLGYFKPNTNSMLYFSPGFSKNIRSSYPTHSIQDQTPQTTPYCGQRRLKSQIS